MNQERDIWDEELHIAVFYGDARTVRRLLDSGVDVNTSDRFGETALMTAVCCEKPHFNPEIIDRLLEREAAGGRKGINRPLPGRSRFRLRPAPRTV